MNDINGGLVIDEHPLILQNDPSARSILFGSRAIIFDFLAATGQLKIPKKSFSMMFYLFRGGLPNHQGLRRFTMVR